LIAGAGTLLNTSTVVVGGVVGLTAGHHIPLRVRDAAVSVLGLFTLVLGVKTAVLPNFSGAAAPDFAIVLVALLVGTVVGAWIGITRWLERVSLLAQRRFAATADGSTFGEAFLTTSLLFCVGPLTILGSFEDGAHGDILLLAIKSALDGVAALAFATTLGPGVLLSAITVLVTQGTLTAVAYLTRGALDPYLISQALGAGGIMLVGIGMGLLKLARLPVADMLPALVVAPLFALLVRSLGWPI